MYMALHGNTCSILCKITGEIIDHFDQACTIDKFNRMDCGKLACVLCIQRRGHIHSLLRAVKALVYTTDETYQNKQQQKAQQTIIWVAKRYSSSVHCVEELEWWRSIYQAFGNWQTAIDLLEEQMIAWGRKEQEENRELVEQFEQLLRQNSVASTKAEWDEDDYTVRGKARAHSEVRYAVRFWPLAEAIDALEQTCQAIMKVLGGTFCSEPDRLKGRGAAAELKSVLDNLGTYHKGIPHNGSG